MNLIPLPAFQDGYLWVLHDGQRALAVDPGDAQPVLHFLLRDGLQLEAILGPVHTVLDSANVAQNAPVQRSGVAIPGGMDRVKAAGGCGGHAGRTHEYKLTNLNPDRRGT